MQKICGFLKLGVLISATFCICNCSAEVSDKICLDQNDGGSEKLSELQSRYLNEIQVLARKGGMPEDEWKQITEYDRHVCYEIDCLESGKFNNFVQIIATNFFLLIDNLLLCIFQRWR